MGGAIEQYIKFLSKELIIKNHTVTILTRAINGLPEFEKENKIRIIRRKELNNIIANPDSKERDRHRLKTIVSDIKPDVIYANHHSSLMAIYIGRKLSIPVVYGCHGWGLLCPLKIRLIRPDNSLCYNERSLNNCTNCHSMTRNRTAGLPGLLKAIKHFIVRYTIVPWRIGLYSKYERMIDGADARIGNSNLTSALFSNMKTVYLGIDSDIYKKQSPDLFVKRFNIHEPYILAPGRINNIKGQEWAIRAMKHLPSKYSLVIAGTSKLFSGPEDPENQYLIFLKALTAELGLDSRIIFTGLLEREELIQAYSGALATIVPSIWLESFGYVTTEAMACECPVIVTENCGSAELVVNNVNGFVVPRMDAVSIADAVTNIVPNHSQLGRQARLTVKEKLDGPKITDQVLEILTRAANINN